MRTVTRVFLLSGGFAVLVTAVYWFVTHEWAGSVLLGLMGAATLFVAAYTWFATRGRRPPPEDRDDAAPYEGEAEEIASFTVDSPWPIVFGVGIAIVTGGMVFGAPLLLLGAVIVVVAAVGMMRESVG